MTTIKIISPNLESERAWTMNGATSVDRTPDVNVELDCQRATLRVAIDTAGAVGAGVGPEVWHGHVRRYATTPMSDDAAAALLERLIPLAERVVDGYESVWDGSNDVAELDDDATEADAENRGARKRVGQ